MGLKAASAVTVAGELTARTAMQRFDVFLSYVAGFKLPWHQVAVAGEADAWAKSPQDRLVLLLPPGQGKSTILTGPLAAYIAAIRPGARVLLVARTNELAERGLRQAKLLVRAGVFRDVLPDPEKADRFLSVEAAVPGSSLAGRGLFTHVILDDIDVTYLASYTHGREPRRANRLSDWLFNHMATRLEDEGHVLMVMSRAPHGPDAFTVVTQWPGHGLQPWPYCRWPAVAEPWSFPERPAQWHAFWDDFLQCLAVGDAAGASAVSAVFDDWCEETGQRRGLLPDRRQVGELLWPEVMQRLDLQSCYADLGGEAFRRVWQCEMG